MTIAAAFAVWQALGPGGNGPASESIVVTAPVERRTLEETVVTRGVTGFVATRELAAVAPGTVTTNDVGTGDVVESGTRLLALNGRPLVAVAATTPFWRELSLGADGPDVRQLQQVLTAAGHEHEAEEGSFDEPTEQVLKEWQAAHGYPVADGVLRPGDMVTGSWPQRVGENHVAVGDIVDPGAPLISFTAQEPVVTLQLLPSDKLRVEAGHPTRVELAATGTTATGVLGDVSSAATTLDDGSLVYLGSITLDEPLVAPEGTQAVVTIVVRTSQDAIAVPLASLFSDATGRSVVRVVDADGSIRSVPVELGISEGAYVEVVTGLDGSESVVVAERS